LFCKIHKILYCYREFLLHFLSGTVKRIQLLLNRTHLVKSSGVVTENEISRFHLAPLPPSSWTCSPQSAFTKFKVWAPG